MNGPRTLAIKETFFENILLTYDEVVTKSSANYWNLPSKRFFTYILITEEAQSFQGVLRISSPKVEWNKGSNLHGDWDDF